MFRLNVDGTVDRCDDTPDEDWTVIKYQRSAMREGKWICCSVTDDNGYQEWQRRYIDDSEVPKIIKMFDLLEP